MRTIWKGAVSFGLVHVPVKLYPATEHREIKFKYLHAKCKTPIKYERRCPTCGVEVPLEEIVRGYEYEKGSYVVFSEEDFEDLPVATDRTVAIMDFINLEEIDPIYFSKSYYLVPNDGGQKAYALLRRAMKESGKIAVAKVALRARESLAVLRVYENCLLMETMLYPDEIRSAGHLSELHFDEGRLHDNEIKMAVNLINNLSEEFHPEKYTDEYREALMARIEAKVEGREVEVAPHPEAEKVVDLLEALQASIRLTQGDRKAKSKRAGKARGAVGAGVKPKASNAVARTAADPPGSGTDARAAGAAGLAGEPKKAQGRKRKTS